MSHEQRATLSWLPSGVACSSRGGFVRLDGQASLADVEQAVALSDGPAAAVAVSSLLARGRAAFAEELLLTQVCLSAETDRHTSAPSALRTHGCR
jgi:hypothetical protein